jgi:hypothetical protein
MPDMTLPYATLTGMLAPALFMTATGSLLLSANNRLARIVDRLRVLVDRLDQLGQGKLGGDFLADREEKLLADVARQKKRVTLVLGAITRLHMAFASFVGTSLTLAIDTWTGHALQAVPTSLAVLGVLLLLSAGYNLFREAWGAVAVLHEEVAFMEKLRRKRQEQHEPAPPGTNPP